MIFERTPLRGVWVVDPEPFEDERGSFARTFCEDEFRDRGIDPHVAQCGLSRNPRPATLRGLHLQLPPFGETKLIRCTQGEVFDVAVDLRRESPSFGRHYGLTLSGENGRAIVMPPGVAHGFISLRPDCDVSYQMSSPYAPDAAAGVRWDDPDLAIPWPTAALIVSEKDRRLPGISDWPNTTWSQSRI